MGLTKLLFVSTLLCLSGCVFDYEVRRVDVRTYDEVREVNCVRSVACYKCVGGECDKLFDSQYKCPATNYTTVKITEYVSVRKSGAEKLLRDEQYTGVPYEQLCRDWILPTIVEPYKVR